MKALISTRKGLLELTNSGSGFAVEQVSFEGIPVHYVHYDPVNKVTWAGLAHGHWGAKLHVRKDSESEFREVECPAFPKHTDLSFKNFWSIQNDSLGRVYIGAATAALFHSDNSR